jgi:hypothetical protein
VYVGDQVLQSHTFAPRRLDVVLQDLSSNGSFAIDPSAGIDNAGNAVVTWLVYAGATAIGEPRYVVEAAVRPTGNRRFGLPQIISSPDGNASEPRVAVSSTGDTILVWDERGISQRRSSAMFSAPMTPLDPPPSLPAATRGYLSHVVAAYRPRGATSVFQEPVTLSPPSRRPTHPQVAVDRVGPSHRGLATDNLQASVYRGLVATARIP